jgi:hypothetical protein
MANPITLSFKRIESKLKVYQKANAKFAGSKAMRRIAFTIAKSDELDGIKNVYRRNFKAPVPYTLRSMNYKASGLTADLITNDDESKGNAPAKYLFPVIGGGSNEVFYTRFQEYLRGKGYMNNSDYAFANKKNPKIRYNKYGNVTPTTYKNTMIGLSKTKKGQTARKSAGAKIQDTQVFAFKQDWKNGQGDSMKAGIWRVKSTKKSGGYLQPLFFFAGAPSVPDKGKLHTHVKDLFEAIGPNIWIDEIKKAAK